MARLLAVILTLAVVICNVSAQDLYRERRYMNGMNGMNGMCLPQNRPCGMSAPVYDRNKRCCTGMCNRSGGVGMPGMGMMYRCGYGYGR